MKIKEVMMESIELPKYNEADSEDLSDAGPFAFTWFTIDLAAIYVYAAAQLLSMNMPTMVFGGNRTGGKGKRFEEIRAMDVLNVLTGTDMLRHSAVFQQALGFMNWYLEQEEPENEENEEPTGWNDAAYIEKKWNEYARTIKEKMQK